MTAECKETVAEVSHEDHWRQALIDAADYLETWGWRRYHPTDGRTDGPTDLMSALAKVCLYSSPYARAVAELKKALGMNPLEWDHQHGRTKVEVLAALRGCAAVR